MRGLVILLLVPDLSGAFSIPEMARRFPDDGLWTALARQASHVPWQGLALWDLVMPAFVLLVGISMALSIDRRRAAGARPSELAAHAALRSAALVVLGMLLQMTHRSPWTEVLPYAVLAMALPWADLLARWTGANRVACDRIVGLWLPALVVCAVAVWMGLNSRRLEDYSFNQILTQLGLAHLPAFALMGRDIRAAVVAALVILALYGLAFIAYEPPPGLAVHGDVMTGLFGHWNNGTNLAAAADRWLFAGLPRGVPYVDNAHGYHTIEFVPLMAVMLLGVAVGRLLASGPLRSLPKLMAFGCLAVAIGGVLALGAVPLVKSLWTPSWALLTTGICVLVLCGFIAAFDAPGRARVAYPLIVLGTNALLLYVVSGMHRWRLVAWLDRLGGEWLLQSPYRPVLESLGVLALLWLLAAALHRQRIHLRL